MFFNKNITLNCNGQLIDLAKPKVMGILNLTPDSFYDGGQHQAKDAYLHHVNQLLKEGADIIDVGGMSSRPGAEITTIEEELKRVIEPIEKIIKEFPSVLISIDTLHSKVALEAIQHGASIVNDISAGLQDMNMISTVAQLNVPYILMHMQGRPNTMQELPAYENITLEILDFFIERIKTCRAEGIKDIVLDPGFGFGKTIAHNFSLLNNLRDFDLIELPILVGLSRKSMIYKVLDETPNNALNGSTALHMIALENGASILRVHDVKEAKECIALHLALHA